jgi:hypothetical protein
MLIRGALVMFAVSWTGYWIGGLAVAVLLLIWALLSTAEGPPVLALALTYQWMQVTIGLFYSTLTGEELEAMYQTDWQRMMLIGLGWVTCLAVAMFYGIVLTRRRIAPSPDAPGRAVSAKVLYVAYGGSLLLTGVIQELAWKVPHVYAGDPRDHVHAPRAAVRAHAALHAPELSVGKACDADGD